MKVRSLLLLTAIQGLWAANISDNHNDNLLTEWDQVGGPSWVEDADGAYPASGLGSEGFLINQATTFDNGTLKATVHADQWNGEAGGVVFRYTSPNNFYFVSMKPANSTSNEVYFCKNTLNVSSCQVIANNLSASTTYDVEVVAFGSQFEIKIDGASIATVTDSENAIGKVGYGYGAQWSSYVDFISFSWTDNIASGASANMIWLGEFATNPENPAEGNAYHNSTTGTSFVFHGGAWEVLAEVAQGPQGPQGEKGDQGEAGVQGSQGEKGDQGEAGVQGLQGEKGDQGEAGAQGSQGEKGDQGEAGVQGPQGEKGDQGEAGVQGSQGEIGPQGLIGLTGAQGPQGTPGQDAPDQSALLASLETRVSLLEAFFPMSKIQGSVVSEGRTFILLNTPVSGDQAQLVCEEFNMDLAKIASEVQNNAVTDMMGYQSNLLAWMGANDIETEGTFLWKDGTPVEYARWYDGHPNEGNVDCVSTSSRHTFRGSGVNGGTWGYENCVHARVPVCSN